MLNTFSNHERATHMSQLHVLGIGSPFGDDKLGWEVVTVLQQLQSLKQFTPEQLHLACYDRPGMALLDKIRVAQSVFLIDAVKTGAAVGTLHLFKNEEIEALGNPFSSHALGIAEAIKMGAILNLLPQNIVLYGMEIADVQMQFSISPPIEQAIKVLSSRVESDILSTLLIP